MSRIAFAASGNIVRCLLLFKGAARPQRHACDGASSLLDHIRAFCVEAPRVVSFPLAQTGEGISECELVRWFVEVGSSYPSASSRPRSTFALPTDCAPHGTHATWSLQQCPMPCDHPPCKHMCALVAPLPPDAPSHYIPQEGQEVEEFGTLCEVQSDKANIEITSRYAGRVVKLHHQQGDIVKVRPLASCSHSRQTGAQLKGTTAPLVTPPDSPIHRLILRSNGNPSLTK
jgi:biotin carboxyl carrier protein